MSLDGIAIHALADELAASLIGARIDKIQQPDSSTILLSLRQPGKTDKLLLSCNAQTARICITKSARNAMSITISSFISSRMRGRAASSTA